MADDPHIDLETLQETWAQQVASLVIQVAMLKAQVAAQAALLDHMTDKLPEGDQ